MMRDTIFEPVSMSGRRNSEAGQAVAVRTERRDRGPIFEKLVSLTTPLMTISDMIGFVAKLPIRWKIMDLKTELPLHRKIGYALMLNAVTDMWLLTSGVDRRNADRNSLPVIKNYIGLINTIDDMIDDNENVLFKSLCKDNEIRARRKQLFASVGQFDSPVQKKIKRLFSESTYRMMSATAMFKEKGISCLDDALILRENTAGEMARVVAELFNVTNGVPQDKAIAIEKAYANIGMVIQVYDDILDIPGDIKKGNSENLILHILKQRPDEKARLMKALANKKKCAYRTLKRHAPETARVAVDLQDRYLSAIPETGSFDRIRSLINISVSLRGQSAALRLIYDKTDL